MPLRQALLASTIECLRTDQQNVRGAQAVSCVNTSLSEKLFFSLCWCIRDAVHSIPSARSD
jgi:hypothetical protein